MLLVFVFRESYRGAMHESASIQSKTEQNQSPSLPVRYLPITLAQDLPIHMHYPHEHGDHPIQMLHMHACWELGYCFEGSGIIIVGSKVLSFAKGAVSLIGPDEPHFAMSLPGTTSRWAWIYLNPLQLAGRFDSDLSHLDPSTLHGETFNNILASEHNNLPATAMRQLVNELLHKETGHEAMIRALVCQIMLLYRRLNLQTDKVNSKPCPPIGGLMSRLAPALEYLASHYHVHLDVPSLADRCALFEVPSPSLHRRVF